MDKHHSEGMNVKKGAAFDEKNTLAIVTHGTGVLFLIVVLQPVAQVDGRW